MSTAIPQNTEIRKEKEMRSGLASLRATSPWLHDASIGKCSPQTYGLFFFLNHPSTDKKPRDYDTPRVTWQIDSGTTGSNSKPRDSQHIQ